MSGERLGFALFRFQKSMPDKLTEHDIQLQIQEYLALQGHYVWRQNTGMATYGHRKVRFGKVGASDLVGVHKSDGRIICLEIKKPDGKWGLQPAQEAFLEEI